MTKAEQYFKKQMQKYNRILLTFYMKLSLIVLISVITISVASTSAQNPFFSKKKNDQTVVVSTVTLPPNPFILKISIWQKQLNKKMASLLKEVHQKGNIVPFLILLSISFLYGILHAAGPGHGKAVAASYLIAHGKKVKDGIIIGNIIALMHGISGVVLILVLHAFLTRGFSEKVENITYITQLVSYLLIIFIGAFLFIKHIYSVFLTQRKQINTEQEKIANESKKPSIFVALTIGCIPCPGIVLVMLFSISLNATLLGIILALSMSMGMAVTISLVGISIVAGKKLFLGSINRYRKYLIIIEHIIAILSAFLIMSIGILLCLSL